MSILYTVQFWNNGQEDFKKDGDWTFTKEKIYSQFETEERPDRDEVWENEDWTISARSDTKNYLYTPIL